MMFQPGVRLLKDALPGGSWSGRPAVCIGGGPSLLNFDWSALNGWLTIGVNRVFERFDPTIIFTMDKGFYIKVEQGIYGQEALARWRSSCALKALLQARDKVVPPGVFLIPHYRSFAAAHRSFTFNLEEGLGHGNNSGYGALNLAVCLGANPIYLLGYDMRHEGGRSHWHEGHPSRQSPVTVARFIPEFNRASIEIKKRGFDVINLNPDSALKCFRFGDRDATLRKASGAIDPPALRVSNMSENKVQSQCGITAITLTGDRPLAFALCEHWTSRQTRRPDQWIVVDDGKAPMVPTGAMEYVRREPRPDDPRHTMILNMKVALPFVKGDKVIIMEDDEYYAEGYIEEMSRHLDQHEVVGIMRSKYYHVVSGGYCAHPNTKHASLCATAFRNSFLPDVKGLLNGDSNQYLDLRIWPKARGRGYLFEDDEKPLYLGIKGLPGRSGICKGHDSAWYRQFDTADRAILKKWVPADYQVYLDIATGKLTSENFREYFQ